MTVKELIKTLHGFDENLTVMAIDDMGGFFPIVNVTRGVNECDGILFLDGFQEDMDGNEEETN